MSEQDTMPRQRQEHQPGSEAEMSPRPDYEPRFPGVGKLAGKVAIVTGGDSGIGRAVAVLFAREGADVAIVYKEEDEDAEETAEAIRAEGRECLTIAGDIGREAFCREAVERTVQELGQVDILVNNAGITRDQLFMRMSDADWDAVIAVNLTSVMRLSRGVLRGMMKARWGRIVSVSSIVGVTGNPGQGNYAASKAGVIGMSKSLAQEVASRGITVNVIAPGFIATAMTDKLSDEQKARIDAQIPAGRMGTADEIAAAAVYLASAEAAYVTGQTLHVNGGMAMI